MKNEYEIRGNITAIIIHSPKYGTKETIISTSMLGLAKQFGNSWYVRYERKTQSFYAVGNMTIGLNKRRTYGLHQWLMGLPQGMGVDHINHDTLNNTEGNLRIVTTSQNAQNRKGATRVNVSGIRGVTWCESKSKWRVRIGVNGKYYFFGHYKTKEEAEKVAIEKRKLLLPYSNEAL